MSEAGVLQQVQLIAVRGLSERIAVPAIVNLVREAVPSSFNCFAWLNDQGLPTDFYIPEIIPSAIEAIVSQSPVLARDPAAYSFDKMARAPRDIDNFSALTQSGVLDTSVYTNEVARPYRVGNDIDLIIRRGGRTAGVMFACREPHSGPFTAREREFLLRLRPFLQHALNPPEPPPAAGLDESRTFAPGASATVVVDPGGGIEAMSGEALTVMCEWLDQPVAAGVPLAPLARRLPDPLLALLRRTEAIEAGQGAPAPRAARRTRAGVVTARAYSLPGADRSRPAQRFCLVLERHETPEVWTARRLAHFDLSPAERRVAYEMALERPTDEALTRLGIRYQTWRDYTKRIYRRVGVDGRAAFLRRLH